MHLIVLILSTLVNPITNGGAEYARGVKMLSAAQKPIARIFQIL